MPKKPKSDITVRVDQSANIALIESDDLNKAMRVDISIAVMPNEIDKLIDELEKAKKALHK